MMTCRQANAAIAGTAANTARGKGALAQDLKPNTLPPSRAEGGIPLMQALKTRRLVLEYSDRPIPVPRRKGPAMMHEWRFGSGFAFGPIGVLVLAIPLAVPFWRVCERVGFPEIVARLIFVPLVNLVFLYWLAFAEWPSRRDAPPPG